MKLENDFEQGIITGLILIGFIVCLNYLKSPTDWRLIAPFVGLIVLIRNIWTN